MEVEVVLMFVLGCESVTVESELQNRKGRAYRLLIVILSDQITYTTTTTTTVNDYNIMSNNILPLRDFDERLKMIQRL